MQEQNTASRDANEYWQPASKKSQCGRDYVSNKKFVFSKQRKRKEKDTSRIIHKKITEEQKTLTTMNESAQRR